MTQPEDLRSAARLARVSALQHHNRREALERTELALRLTNYADRLDWSLDHQPDGRALTKIWEWLPALLLAITLILILFRENTLALACSLAANFLLTVGWARYRRRPRTQ